MKRVVGPEYRRPRNEIHVATSAITRLLKHHLKQLQCHQRNHAVPTMESECEEAARLVALVARSWAKENVDHLGYLLQLAERELLEREARATERRLKSARFPNLKTLESFDFKAQPSLNKMLVNELMRGAYLVQRESIILIGQPGFVPPAQHHREKNRAACLCASDASRVSLRSL